MKVPGLYGRDTELSIVRVVKRACVVPLLRHHFLQLCSRKMDGLNRNRGRKRLLLAALVVLGAAPAFAQVCGNKEPITDYPDGSYMSSTSSDPCGSGGSGFGVVEGRKIDIPKSMNPTGTVRLDWPEVITLTRVRPSSREVPNPARCPAVPFLFTSNQTQVRRNEA